MDRTEYTATEIAETLCASQGLELGDQSQLYFRIKYIAKREMLSAARTIDKRGTFAFAPLEVYRAAMLNELVGLAIDVRVLKVVLEAATSTFPIPGAPVAPSLMATGARTSHGGLRDAIRGIAAGEDWFLKIWRVNPSNVAGETVRAAIVCGDLPVKDIEGFDKDSGGSPSRAHVSVDLTAIFAPLIGLVGVPE